ncbi:MAG: hypothetical protein IPN63_07795 [Gammaproteobacteria bacterium]|nr:hypothetical protein [Gammaproteobacteria bacterium]MBK9427277.1 hypothetical protein [Gammaproteobacteria bacterium]
MKAIINGKKFDTDTAEHIANASYSGSRSDFQWWEEDFYRKRTGECFLAGRGGPMTRYAVAVDQNSRTGGSKITPLSEEEAREWLECHADAETYEQVFGAVPE